MMKKYASKVLAAAMVVSMMVPMSGVSVLADTVTGNADNKYTTSANTDVKYSVTEEYTWTIHSVIDFGSDNTVTGDDITRNNNTVSVTKNVIPDSRKLVITVKGNGGGADTTTEDTSFKIKNGTTELPYTVKASESEKEFKTGDNVLEVQAGTNTGKVNLDFTLSTKNSTEKAAEVAGSYTGKVIYEAAIKENN